jgi:hypothetical protein
MLIIYYEIRKISLLLAWILKIRFLVKFGISWWFQGLATLSQSSDLSREHTGRNFKFTSLNVFTVWCLGMGIMNHNKHVMLHIKRTEIIIHIFCINLYILIKLHNKSTESVLSLHDSLPYRLCCHYTTLCPTDCDDIKRLSLPYRLCSHYTTLCHTDCDVITRLSLPYRLCCHYTTLSALQTVLSLHDSLPYRLCCYCTTLYPACSAATALLFTYQLWFYGLWHCIMQYKSFGENCYLRTAPQSGRHNLNNHHHENQAFPFTKPKPAASLRPQTDKTWQAYSANSLFHFPRLSMSITNEVHIDISVSIPWQNPHETTNENHKSWRPISRFRSELRTSVLKTRGFLYHHWRCG